MSEGYRGGAYRAGHPVRGTPYPDRASAIAGLREEVLALGVAQQVRDEANALLEVEPGSLVRYIDHDTDSICVWLIEDQEPVPRGTPTERK